MLSSEHVHMRLSRTNRAALVLLFIAVLGAFGTAIDGTALGSDPTIETFLDYQDRTFTVTAAGGVPGGVGLLNFLVVTGPIPGVLQVPFTFDAYGNSTLTVPLADLNNGYDLAIGIQLFTLDSQSQIVFSRVWALTSRNYVVTDPAVQPCPECPTSPGGWVDYVNWPGTDSGPIYPHTLVAIHSAPPRDGSQPMLALESGPAGSFPIN
jgi:hypothetical protein